MKYGDIVARKSDPVHVGRVVLVVGDKVNVRWFGVKEMIEHQIPNDELMLAIDWKSGHVAPATIIDIEDDYADRAAWKARRS